MSSGLRFPAALQVFPLLRRFPAIRPRRLAAVPVGNRGPVDDSHLQACVRHLYHDLGILAYAGCTDAQINRIGDLISRVVGSGGPGAMITMLDWPGKTERRRIEPLDENDVFEAFDTAHSGIIKPRVLFQIADAAFRAHINNHIATSSSTRLDPSNLQLRDRNILIRGIPSPKGIIHEPLSGRRILPVDAFTNIAADKRHGTLRGELELYSAGGKGEYVGACRIDYVIYHADKENRTMKALQAHREFPPNDEGGDVQRQAKRVIKGEVLRELWALEGEVYGEKADRLVRYDKVGLPDRTEQGRRGLARRDRAARGAIEEDVVEGEDGEEAMDDMDQEVAFEQKFRRQRRPTH